MSINQKNQVSISSEETMQVSKLESASHEGKSSIATERSGDEANWAAPRLHVLSSQVTMGGVTVAKVESDCYQPSQA